MKSKIIIIIILGFIIAAAAPGCSLLKKRVQKKEKVTYRMSGVNKTSFSLENTNGEIRISKNDDTLGTVTISAEKIGSVKADDIDKPLDNIKVNVDSTGNAIKVSVETIKSSSGWFHKYDGGKVNFDIKVPVNMRVDIDNTNGAVILTSLANDIKVETVNGKTNINRCSGDIKINGVNGDVAGNFDSLKSLNIEVVNGSVKLGGLGNVSAQVSASTVHGKITYKELTINNLVIEKKTLNGAIGSGKGIIKITTTNGSIILNAKDVTYSKTIQDEFEGFKFDLNFDDEDDNVKTKKKDTAKTLEPQKEQVAPKTQDTSKTK